MDHAVRVGERDRLADALERPQARGYGRLGREVVVEPAPPDPLHRVEPAPVRQRAHVVHRHQARVLEPGQHARLAQQALVGLRARLGQARDLERDLAAELAVEGRGRPCPCRRARSRPGSRSGPPARSRQSATARRWSSALRRTASRLARPAAARASARNSSSEPHRARSVSRRCRRSSLRMAERWFVTWVTGRPSSARPAAYVGGVGAALQVVALEDGEGRPASGLDRAPSQRVDRLLEEARIHSRWKYSSRSVSAAGRIAGQLALGAREVERPGGGRHRRASARAPPRAPSTRTRPGRSAGRCGSGRARRRTARRSPSRARLRRSPGSGPRRPADAACQRSRRYL